MKTLAYQGNGARSWTTVPDPAAEGPRDAVIDGSVLSGRLPAPADLATHRPAPTDPTAAYDTFADPTGTGALPVAPTRT